MKLEMRNVAKGYSGKAILRDCSVSVDSGEIAALGGDNGCGKTTLLSIALGYARPDSGSVSAPVLGAGLSGYANKPILFPDMSGMDNIRFFMDLTGKRDYGDECRSLMDRLGLREDRKRSSSYSTGMIKKYGIIRCLLTKPQLLILDEPFSGIDDAGVAALRDILREYAGQYGLAILMTNHGQSLLANMPITLYRLRDGTIEKGMPQ